MHYFIRAIVFNITLIFCSLIFAQGEPLRVAVEPFAPPFIMQAANNQFYGFDISLIENICGRIDRECQYIVLPFDQLLTAVENDRADVAVSAITITVPRAQRINFSLPYLNSRSRFIGKKSYSKKPFNLTVLNNKRIGIEEGSIFNTQISSMGVQNSQVTHYEDPYLLIEALTQGNIDIALMDNPSAVFWANRSSGRLAVLGEPLLYGFGYGIAVNQLNTQLLRQINAALLQYQNSDAYKKNYRAYFSHLRS